MGRNKRLLAEVWEFLRERKAWWLAPIAIMLILIGVIIVFSQASSVSPFIYALVQFSAQSALPKELVVLGIIRLAKRIRDLVFWPINAVLLTPAYFLGIGSAWLFAKARGKRFLDIGMPSAGKAKGSSTWKAYDLSTRKKDRCYRQF